MTILYLILVLALFQSCLWRVRVEELYETKIPSLKKNVIYSIVDVKKLA